MARIRDIKPEFFIDDELAQISLAARLFFIGLWTVADKAGRLVDRPEKLRVQIMPYDADVHVEDLLNELASKSFIIRYESDGRKLIQIRSFEKHQSPHPKEKPSELPAPPAVTTKGRQPRNGKAATSSGKTPTSREKKRQDGDKQVVSNGSVSDQPVSSNPALLHYGTSALLHSGTPRAREELFQIFWQAWPAKVAKQDAWKAFRKLKLPDGQSLDDFLTQVILPALEQQKSSPRWREENGRYIPNPATWLNGKRWQDEIVATHRSEPGANKSPAVQEIDEQKFYELQCSEWASKKFESMPADVREKRLQDEFETAKQQPEFIDNWNKTGKKHLRALLEQRLRRLLTSEMLDSGEIPRFEDWQRQRRENRDDAA